MNKRSPHFQPIGLVNRSMNAEAMRLSDPAFAQQAEALKERLSRDPKFAREMLHRAGILTSHGRVAKAFGG